MMESGPDIEPFVGLSRLYRHLIEGREPRERRAALAYIRGLLLSDEKAEAAKAAPPGLKAEVWRSAGLSSVLEVNYADPDEILTETAEFGEVVEVWGYAMMERRYGVMMATADGYETKWFDARETAEAFATAGGQE